MRVEVEYAREASHAGVGDCYEVAVLVTHDNGHTMRRIQVFPCWSVAARMAEYNVSQAEAIRILLAEPHLPGARPDVPPVLADPIWRRGADAHRAEVDQAFATLGFDPLDARVEDRPTDPTSLMLEVGWSADEVSALRMRVADLRQALREHAPTRLDSAPSAVPADAASR